MILDTHDLHIFKDEIELLVPYLILGFIEEHLAVDGLVLVEILEGVEVIFLVHWSCQGRPKKLENWPRICKNQQKNMFEMTENLHFAESDTCIRIDILHESLRFCRLNHAHGP